MGHHTVRAILLSLFLGVLAAAPVGAQGQPDGQLTVAFDASIASSFLDPAETPGLGTPFVFLYALHDALIKPLPGNDMAPCLAESWKESADGLVYEFKLREGLRFHNGDPFTAEEALAFISAVERDHPDPTVLEAEVERWWEVEYPHRRPTGGS